MNRFVLPIILTIILTTSCTAATEEAAPILKTVPRSRPEEVTCTSPRPMVCTMEYDPVCATRDNGVRCVTVPCDNTEEATYSNGCVACSDLRVYSYRPGRCESPDE